MTLFIAHENQRLLWNTLRNVPLFSQTIPDELQTEWFREIIGTFYESRQYDTLTNDDLNMLNKSILSYMINLLKQQNVNHLNNGNLEVSNSNTVTKIENIMDGEMDKPIENIDELIRRQEEERKIDITPKVESTTITWSDEKIFDLEVLVKKLQKTVVILQKKIELLEEEVIPYVVPKVLDDVIENISLSIEEN